eukprot:scaffold1918_cov154-Amphora_coffeaeformis.AAC.23
MAQDDGFNGKPEFPRPNSSATRTTASVTTGPRSPPLAQYYNYTSLAPPRVSSPTDVPRRRTPSRNRYFPANDSLAEVLDQPTVNTAETNSTNATPRSKASEKAEQELIKSFKRAGKREARNTAAGGGTGAAPRLHTMASTVPRAIRRGYYDEKKDDEYDATVPLARSSTAKSSNQSLGHASSTAGKSSFVSSAGAINLPPPAETPKSIDASEKDPSTADTSRDTSREFSTSGDDLLLRTSPSGGEHLDLTLHDLCAEAVSQDDIAWRNALSLLTAHPHLASVVDPGAEQFTPLHVSCLSTPPSFLILGLLYAHPTAARMPDAGGRLPLHLVAASSADTETMQLLVNEYPAAVSHTDHVGLTPLHLYLRRHDKEISPEAIQILLGQTASLTATAQSHHKDEGNVLFRRGSHFLPAPQDLTKRVLQRPRPVTRFTRVDHEAALSHYAPNIQVSLRKLSRHQNRVSSSRSNGVQEESREDEAADDDGVSPAAIPIPTSLELPIHMVIRRVLEQQEQHDLQPQDTNDDGDMEQESSPKSESDFSSDNDGDDNDSKVQGLVHANTADTEQPRLRAKSALSDPKMLKAMLLLIEAFPEGLSLRDGDGCTPLLMVLTAGDQIPCLDVVLVLLGRRTPVANKEWSVDVDLPLHNLSSSKSMWMNPAMVPTSWSNQLPLHICAEEFVSELPLVQAIYEAYPAAIQVQDGQGRTPLHLALNSYRKIPVDPRVLNMMLSDTVAQTQDRKGQVPLDVMLENAESLPDAVPWAWKLAEANDPAVGTVYQRFFHSSLLHLASSSSSAPGAGREILHDLQALPQWLRRQACVSTFVQELLIEELATPWKCAFVLLDGILLVSLLTVFRLQMNQYIVSGSYLPTWYTIGVYGFAAGRFLFLGAQGAMASRLGQYNDTILWNLWYWIDYIAMVLAVVTSVLFNGSSSEDTLLSLGTAATGFLWWSVIGYVSRWSFAMAVFTGILSQLANYVFYVLIAFGAVVVAFGQMLYTVFQTSCEDAIAQSAVCSVRDSYRVIYLLLRGASLADETGTTTMSIQAITMVTTFFFFLLVVAVGLLAIVVLVAGQADIGELARRSYWEPMLAYVMSMNTLGFCGRYNERTFGDAMSAKLGVAWDVLTFHFTRQGSSKNTHWFVKSRHIWVLAPFSFLIIYVWFFLGLVTLGFLWPPQLRRALFRPSTLWRRQRSVVRSSETTSQQIHALRSETVKFKVLSYDRMASIEKELRDVKDLLYVALRED